MIFSVVVILNIFDGGFVLRTPEGVLRLGDIPAVVSALLSWTFFAAMGEV